MTPPARRTPLEREQERQEQGGVIAGLLAGIKQQEQQRESALAALIARGYAEREQAAATAAAPDPQNTTEGQEA